MSQFTAIQTETVMTKREAGKLAAIKLPKEKWSRGKRGGTVVSDTSQYMHEDPDTVEYYGGHLIAESIPEIYINSIAALPNLLKALELLTPQECPIVTHHSPNCAFCFAIKTLAEVRGEGEGRHG